MKVGEFQLESMVRGTTSKVPLVNNWKLKYVEDGNNEERHAVAILKKWLQL